MAAFKDKYALLTDLGNKLGQQLPKDALTKTLKQASTTLSELPQTAPELNKDRVLGPLAKALVQKHVIQHKDKDVRLLVASCLCDVLKLFAPNAPYSDVAFQEMFRLFIRVFSELRNVSSPTYSRRLYILESLAKYKSCIVMLDIHDDTLMVELFRTLFDNISSEHSHAVAVHMLDIMSVIVNESDDPHVVLDTVLANLLPSKREESPAAYKLVQDLLKRCEDHFQPAITKFLVSAMVDCNASDSELKDDRHELMFQLYLTSPQLLISVLPHVQNDLVVDLLETRLKAVELLGNLFCLDDADVVMEYRHMFTEFLKRFTDKSTEVRLQMVHWSKDFLLKCPHEAILSDVSDELAKRRLDHEDKVRAATVSAVFEAAAERPDAVATAVLQTVADRVRDKKVGIRKDVLSKLALVFRSYCVRVLEGSMNLSERFTWIPSRIVRCFYDTDVRQLVETIITEELFPPKLPVEDRVQHWIAVFSEFEEIDRKALGVILQIRKRTQDALRQYLELRDQLRKDTTNQELVDKMTAMGSAMASLVFPNDAKAAEQLGKLQQVKDNGVFKLLALLLDPMQDLATARSQQEEVAKRLGAKHHLHEHVKRLAQHVSYTVFGRDHVREALKATRNLSKNQDKDGVQAGLDLLMVVTSVYPELLAPSAEDMFELLQDGDSDLAEGAVRLLAQAGSDVKTATPSDMQYVPQLTALCMKGTRKQAKFAVAALARMCRDESTAVFGTLAEEIMERLQDADCVDDPTLPTALQTLGCIAQHCPRVIKSKELELTDFVVKQLLPMQSGQRRNKKKDVLDWSNPSAACSLKVYGIRLLTKIVAGDKNAASAKGFLGLLAKLLPYGEVPGGGPSDEIDTAHIRLAAAASVLNLARLHDSLIAPKVFHLTMLTVQDHCYEVRRKCVIKVKNRLTGHKLAIKYAVAYALAAVDIEPDNVADAKLYMEQFVQQFRKAACAAESKAANSSTELPSVNLVAHPEFVLPYLVHTCAHHPDFPAMGADSKAYEPFERMIGAAVRPLLHPDADSSASTRRDNESNNDNVPAMLAILRSIKNTKDAVDVAKTHDMCVLCDVALELVKELTRKRAAPSLGTLPAAVPLPRGWFEKLSEEEGSQQNKVDGSHLPAGFRISDRGPSKRVATISPRLPKAEAPKKLRSADAENVDPFALENENRSPESPDDSKVKGKRKKTAKVAKVKAAKPHKTPPPQPTRQLLSRAAKGKAIQAITAAPSDNDESESEPAVQLALVETEAEEAAPMRENDEDDKDVDTPCAERGGAGSPVDETTQEQPADHTTSMLVDSADVDTLVGGEAHVERDEHSPAAAAAASPSRRKKKQQQASPVATTSRTTRARAKQASQDDGSPLPEPADTSAQAQEAKSMSGKRKKNAASPNTESRENLKTAKEENRAAEQKNRTAEVEEEQDDDEPLETVRVRRRR
eukprot:jgi/Chlat1/3563/Chrsp234S03561